MHLSVGRYLLRRRLRREHSRILKIFACARMTSRWKLPRRFAISLVKLRTNAKMKTNYVEALFVAFTKAIGNTYLPQNNIIIVPRPLQLHLVHVDIIIVYYEIINGRYCAPHVGRQMLKMS